MFSAIACRAVDSRSLAAVDVQQLTDERLERQAQSSRVCSSIVAAFAGLDWDEDRFRLTVRVCGVHALEEAWIRLRLQSWA